MPPTVFTFRFSDGRYGFRTSSEDIAVGDLIHDGGTAWVVDRIGGDDGALVELLPLGEGNGSDRVGVDGDAVA